MKVTVYCMVRKRNVTLDKKLADAFVKMKRARYLTETPTEENKMVPTETLIVKGGAIEEDEFSREINVDKENLVYSSENISENECELESNIQDETRKIAEFQQIPSANKANNKEAKAKKSVNKKNKESK